MQGPGVLVLCEAMALVPCFRCTRKSEDALIVAAVVTAGQVMLACPCRWPGDGGRRGLRGAATYQAIGATVEQLVP
jgi:hypothetical protein